MGGQTTAFTSRNSRKHQSHLEQTAGNQNNGVFFTSHGRVPKMEMGVIVLDQNRPQDAGEKLGGQRRMTTTAASIKNVDGGAHETSLLLNQRSPNYHGFQANATRAAAGPYNDNK